MIDAERSRLAEAVVDRQYRHHPGLRQKYGETGRAKCVDDTEYHLSYLAAVVRFSSAVLYRDYMTWAKTVMAAYSVAPEDVEQNLICLGDVLSERLPPALGEAVAPYPEIGRRAEPSTPAPPSFLEGDDALTSLAREYLLALLRVERHEASRLVVEAVRDGATVPDVYLGVFQPSQREIGRLCQLKPITVAQEHYCTAATQVAMSLLYPHLFALPKKGARLVAASVDGENARDRAADRDGSPGSGQVGHDLPRRQRAGARHPGDRR